MSLTGLLRGTNSLEKEFQAILKEITPNRNLFQTVSGKKAFVNTEYEIFVPCTSTDRETHLIIGIAFKYLARIMLARVVENNKSEFYSDIKPKGGLIILSKILSEHTFNDLNKQYKKSVRRMRKFVNNKKNIQGIILEVYFIATLEHIYISGTLPGDISIFDAPNEDVIKNIEQLCVLFQKQFIPTVNQYSEITYYPHYGVTSIFVGGTDSDVIIDGTLYEFDSQNKIAYKWLKVARLISCYLLNDISLEINMIDESRNKDYQCININRIAFYKTRFGEIEYVDLTNLNKYKVEIAKMDIVNYFIENLLDQNIPMTVDPFIIGDLEDVNFKLEQKINM